MTRRLNRPALIPVARIFAWCAVGCAGVLLLTAGCSSSNSDAFAQTSTVKGQEELDSIEDDDAMQIATFGNGCFWCTEAVFDAVDGVEKVVSGYAGGEVENPTYQQVCTGQTGHAEVIQIQFDPSKVRYEELLEIFWKTHDPTTLNRQGADIGTQYRSVIFYHSEEQRDLAEHYMVKLDESGVYNDPIVTEISEVPVFYPAEDYHQEYFANNPTQGYCRAVIAPKMEKFREVFADKLKD